jgi:RimJ/RimL family protein N-acetyltransferase
MPLREFPKQVQLQDGTAVTLRLMVRDDRDALLDFFRRLSPEDRQFLKDDVVRPEIVEAWTRDIDYDRVLPILAVHEGRIVGDATLHRRPHGWMRHVGEIRVATDPFFRRRGLATVLAREIFYLALQAGLDKMVAEIAADQVAALKVFGRLGFQQEARLAGQIVDLHGRKHDLVILTTDIPALMAKMQETFYRAAGSGYQDD